MHRVVAAACACLMPVVPVGMPGGVRGCLYRVGELAYALSHSVPDGIRPGR